LAPQGYTHFMADKITLSAQTRTIFGKKVKKLRKEKIIPSNVFGSHIKSVALAIKIDDFRKAFEEAGESTIVYLNIDGETKQRPVLIRPPQVHPTSREILHVDLRQVNLKEKIKTMIDIVLVGEAPAQAQGALIIKLKDQIEVEALPTDLPEQIEVNIESLANIEDVILAKDLKIDKTKIEIQLDDEEIVVKAEAPKEEEVEKAPVEEVAEEEGVEGGSEEEKQKTEESKKEEQNKE